MSIFTASMSRLPIFAGLSVLLLTTACAPHTGTPSTAVTLTALSEPPARDGNYHWFLDNEDDEVRLFYGLEQSDDIPLGLSCTRGSNRITISTPGEDRNMRRLTLTSGGRIASYPARAEEATVFDGYDIVAQTTPADPVMEAFALNGWLAIASDGGWVGLVGVGSSRQSASRFMAACKR